jgi:hypothetical protein
MTAMDRNQVFADPEAIEEAAISLEKLAMKVRDFDNRLERQLSDLNVTFQDVGYERFKASVDTTRKLTAKFADETDAVVPKMRDDAKLIRAAQHLKPNA